MPRAATQQLALRALRAMSQQGAGALRGAGFQSTRSMLTAAAANSGLRAKTCPCGKVFCAGHCACGNMKCTGHSISTSAASAQAAEPMPADSAAPTLSERAEVVRGHFPTAMGVDDMMARVEMALASYGFNGDNTIAMSNLCRDESCMILEDKIEAVFGSCFSTHGLGGVLTCGVIGMKAGLSHSPVENGKERYVFFSFPHIAIDSNGQVGAISRPNRPGASAACGALIKTMMDLQAEGVDSGITNVGHHDPHEPEFSILKNRVARMLKLEQREPGSMNLVDFTKTAEKVITADLEFLISQAVDPSKADYAVVTGVQIHNWAHDLENESVPSMEFVAPASMYVVVDGQRTDLDMQKVPSLSPRQLRELAAKSNAGAHASASSQTGSSTLQEIPREYLMRRLGGVSTSADVEMSHDTPAWRAYIQATYKN